ncbi:MAG: FAD-dependent oxidoreductase [Streptosporangiales bacterium]|nr:FAD-dependent oxidoreductase [Streptosporangiales bacterium]
MTRTENTTVAVVGGGPAGVMLGLLLARAGIEVTVLEKHSDFLRDFRGDTIHPSTLQLLDELGLIDEFLKLPHYKAYELAGETDSGRIRLADLKGLGSTRYPYIAFVPQWDFLDLMTDIGRTYPTFRLVMKAEGHTLLTRGRQVTGVRYSDPDGEHELHADLVVAADGRDSRLRDEARLRPRDLGAPMDVAWFRISRKDTDPAGTFGKVTRGDFLVNINRGDYWQLAYLIPKDGYPQLVEAGIQTLRDRIARLLPFLADRTAAELRSFDDVSVLTVALNRLRRWHRPGLLLIGDAAHAMSPIGGVGINLAIQDAVAAANLLYPKLRAGTVTEADLARVQRRRTPPTVVTQGIQRFIQRRVIASVLGGGSDPVRVPAPLRLILSTGLPQRVTGQFIGVGVRPEHVRTPDRGRSAG